jgi:hypothetical protein
MNRSGRHSPYDSRKSIKSRTAIAHPVHERLRLKHGGTLRDRLTEDGVPIDKAPAETDDPFAAFSEWAREADEKAYDKL